MDVNGFREAQSPWFFSQPPTYLVETRSTKAAIVQKQTLPTQDNRFPGWAAPMNDGRIITDYRSQCELNIPTGMQAASRQFMQRNAVDIIHKSRDRQILATGAGLPYDASTVMPPLGYVSCDEFNCRVTPNLQKGVGIERVEGCPKLFGTFAESRPSIVNPIKPMITQKYEGGRNTVRGVFN